MEIRSANGDTYTEYENEHAKRHERFTGHFGSRVIVPALTDTEFKLAISFNRDFKLHLADGILVEVAIGDTAAGLDGPDGKAENGQCFVIDRNHFKLNHEYVLSDLKVRDDRRSSQPTTQLPFTLTRPDRKPL